MPRPSRPGRPERSPRPTSRPEKGRTGTGGRGSTRFESKREESGGSSKRERPRFSGTGDTRSGRPTPGRYKKDEDSRSPRDARNRFAAGSDSRKQFDNPERPRFKGKRDEERPRPAGGSRSEKKTGAYPTKKTNSTDLDPKRGYSKSPGRGFSKNAGDSRSQYKRKPNRRVEGDQTPFAPGFKKASRFKRPARDESAPERKSFVQSRLQKQRHRRSSQDAPESDTIRLNRFIANSGVCSRREADELIAMGVITVNGTTVTELGYKVKRTDDVRYEGKRLKAEKPVYILLNKPKGFITTTDDPQERKTVMNLIAKACEERVYPVGRLDRNTTGLLLLTNDGELADRLTHPSYNVKKIYKVELDRPITPSDFEKIRAGVRLDEGRALVDDLAVVSDDKKTVGIELHIGWNRIVRRIFEALDYQVIKLDRVVYAGLDKKDLGRGEWRFLKPAEVAQLKGR